jgi:hypothetical protein
VVVVWSVVWNVGQLHEGSELQRGRAEEMRAQLTAVDVAGPLMDPEYRPGPLFLETKAGPYLEVADQLGTPAYTVDELRDAPARAQRAADVALLEGTARSLAAPPADCRPIVPGPASSPSSWLVITTADEPAEVRAGVFSPRGAVHQIGPNRTVAVPLVGLGDRWSPSVSFEGTGVQTCTTNADL